MYYKRFFRTIVGICAVILLLVLGVSAEDVAADDIMAFSEPDDIGGGIAGNCTWRVTAEGELIFAPIAGTDGVLGGRLNQNMDPYWEWHVCRRQVTSIRFEDGVTLPVNATVLFMEHEKAVTIDMSNVNTSQTTNMSGMFSACKAVTSIDTSGFDTSSVTNMRTMFQGCYKLTELDLSHFDVSRVKDFSYIFNKSTALASLCLDGWDIRAAQDVSSMFAYCPLPELDLSAFQTACVTKYGNMFSNCNNLEKLTVSENFTIPPTLPYAMVSSADNDYHSTIAPGVAAVYTKPAEGTEPDYIAKGQAGSCDWILYTTGELVFSPTDGISGILGGYQSTEPYWPWHPYREQVLAVRFEDGISLPGNVEYLYTFHDSVVSIDMHNVDTSQVTYMVNMFASCDSLATLDISGFITDKVTSMFGMFQNCFELTELDLSHFDVSNVTEFSYMFSTLWELTSLNLDGWQTTSAKSMRSMFDGCTELTTLNLSGFDTSQVTIMESMFTDCLSMQYLDLTSFDTSAVTKRNSELYRGATAPDRIKVSEKFDLNIHLLDTYHSSADGSYYTCVEPGVATVYTRQDLLKIDNYPVYHSPELGLYITDIPAGTATADFLALCSEHPALTVTPGNNGILANGAQITYQNSDGENQETITLVVTADLSGDGIVTALDRIQLTRLIRLLENENGTASMLTMLAADIDGDEHVTTRDRVRLARHVAKWKGYDDLAYFKYK